MKVTLGGDRVGSGNKQKIALHNYERSTHNLSTRFTSTMGAGMIIPCLVIPTMRADVYDININGACRTIPTQKPLYSSFKMQVDVYHAPIRLYQAILHNNPLFIGLKMSQVKFPLMTIETKAYLNKWENGKMANNCLMKYLGLSGIGSSTSTNQVYKRNINAIPMLAYYDICKNYYFNKQENQAYIITSSTTPTNIYMMFQGSDTEHYSSTSYDVTDEVRLNIENNSILTLNEKKNFVLVHSPKWIGEHDTNGTASICFATNILSYKSIGNEIYFASSHNGGTWVAIPLVAAQEIGIISNISIIQEGTNNEYTRLSFEFNLSASDPASTDDFAIIFNNKKATYDEEIKLQNFDIKNIDNMRLNILSQHTLGSAYVIDKTYDELPYSALVDVDSENVTFNKKKLNGIAIKTYQADMFNAWVNSEWIDGENGIAEMSKIAVSDGAIYMDALLLAEKTYNMLNRVAVAGGTYEAWQDVVYTEIARKHVESPIYCGGLSNEIVFDEIVQTTPTEGSPLGTLGGRGIAVKRKGGNVSVKCDEAGYLMAMVSITPRIYYTQGNEFYLTELLSMDDLHKPALDGIGFQNLIGERMCWTDTKLNSNGTIYSRTSVGKLPAWIDYMTNVDRAYGEFADINEQGTMVLNRNYEISSDGTVQDFTTYVDPAKYNYVFANADIGAQNFWVQIDFDIKARRLMSAKQIPNL